MHWRHMGLSVLSESLDVLRPTIRWLLESTSGESQGRLESSGVFGMYEPKFRSIPPFEFWMALQSKSSCRRTDIERMVELLYTLLSFDLLPQRLPCSLLVVVRVDSRFKSYRSQRVRHGYCLCHDSRLKRNALYQGALCVSTLLPDHAP